MMSKSYLMNSDNEIRFYCVLFLILGTGINWQSCPSGTFSNQEGLYEKGQCTACTAGQYCQGEHLTAPTANCSAGMDI